MADWDDTEDLGVDNEQDLDTDSQESDGADDAAADDAPPASQDSSETESKRIRDLTSKWQKAEAEKAKALAQLAKSKSKGPAQSNAQADEFMDFAKEHARNTLYASDPRFSKYGIGVEDITGDTPAEMRASLDRQRKMIDTLETTIRNQVMQEMGMDADVTSTSTDSGIDIGGMSQEDFRKLMARRDSLR